ncbi:MAG TPA: hypothetical protein VHK24_12570 [Steroidobacter sp.]|nr:hypothetical protein [Steroidobacter sp.]
MIESRRIVGVAGAFALVGAVLWGSVVLLDHPTRKAQAGSVEVHQIEERSWAVEVQELATLEKNAEKMRTAAR